MEIKNPSGFTLGDQLLENCLTLIDIHDVIKVFPTVKLCTLLSNKNFLPLRTMNMESKFYIEWMKWWQRNPFYLSSQVKKGTNSKKRVCNLVETVDPERTQQIIFILTNLQIFLFYCWSVHLNFCNHLQRAFLSKMKMRKSSFGYFWRKAKEGNSRRSSFKCHLSRFH